MVNYMFLSYFRDLNLLTEYKQGPHVSWKSTKQLVLMCHLFSFLYCCLLTIWATSHRYLVHVYAPFCKHLLVPSLQIINSWNTGNQNLLSNIFFKQIIEEDSAHRVFKYWQRTCWQPTDKLNAKWWKLIAETVSRNKVKEKVGEIWLKQSELRWVFRRASVLMHFAASLYCYSEMLMFYAKGNLGIMPSMFTVVSWLPVPLV